MSSLPSTIGLASALAFGGPALAQSSGEGLKLYYVGHATVLIKGGAATLLTDPFFSDRILWGLKRKIPPAVPVGRLPKVDLVLISHTHPDHYDEEALRAMRPRPAVVLPWSRGRGLRKKGFKVIELRPWQIYEGGGVKITAVPARHMFGHCLGYLMEVDGTKIYYTGDTKLHAGLERVGQMGVDIMLLPYGGYPVLGSIWTTPQAVQAISRVRPKVVIPIHWGTFERWWTRSQPENLDEFAQAVRRSGSAADVRILQVGEE